MMDLSALFCWLGFATTVVFGSLIPIPSFVTAQNIMRVPATMTA